MKVVIGRGGPVYLIQMAQAVIGSVDFLIVGLMSGWSDVGLYGAPHRMTMAVLTFSLIFQQVVLPGLAAVVARVDRSSRDSLDGLVRVLMIGLVPIAVGATVLAGPMVRGLLHAEYSRRRDFARHRDLAAPVARSGVPLPDHADRDQPRGGRRAPA